MSDRVQNTQDLVKIGGTDVAVNIGAVNDGTLRIVPATAVPESGVDSTGEDTYVTVLTPTKSFRHIIISNEGSNAATVSLDGGVTDTFERIPTGAFELDDVFITTSPIQAKNSAAGSNYSNLTIIVW